jgi:hypothetical protein
MHDVPRTGHFDGHSGPKRGLRNRATPSLTRPLRLQPTRAGQYRRAHRTHRDGIARWGSSSFRAFPEERRLYDWYAYWLHETMFVLGHRGALGQRREGWIRTRTSQPAATRLDAAAPAGEGRLNHFTAASSMADVCGFSSVMAAQKTGPRPQRPACHSCGDRLAHPKLRAVARGS